MSRRQSKDVFEFYRTPAWAVLRLLEALPASILLAPRYLDPCCGDGAVHDAVELVSPGREWVQLDVRYTSVCDGRVDYLQVRPEEARFDVGIFNPPFSLALEFVKQALHHCQVVLMLQRCNWLASASRSEWLQRYTPAEYVLPNRPDFTGGGGASDDYAWFAWGLGHSNVRILNETKSEIRKSQKPVRIIPSTSARTMVGLQSAKRRKVIV